MKRRLWLCVILAAFVAACALEMPDVEIDARGHGNPPFTDADSELRHERKEHRRAIKQEDRREHIPFVPDNARQRNVITWLKSAIWLHLTWWF